MVNLLSLFVFAQSLFIYVTTFYRLQCTFIKVINFRVFVKKIESMLFYSRVVKSIRKKVKGTPQMMMM